MLHTLLYVLRILQLLHDVVDIAGMGIPVADVGPQVLRARLDLRVGLAISADDAGLAREGGCRTEWAEARHDGSLERPLGGWGGETGARLHVPDIPRDGARV